MRTLSPRPSAPKKQPWCAIASVALVLSACSSLLLGQSQANRASPPVFDAASIKINNSGNGRHSLSLNLPGGRIRAINVSLAGFMTAAYQVPASRIIGAPSWFDSKYFDIDAISGAPNEGNATFDQNRLRLQSLLADRFNLTIHHETRQLPAYALVLVSPGKFGPHLQIDDEKCAPAPPTTTSAYPVKSDGGVSSLNCGDVSGRGSSNSTQYLGRAVTMDRFLAVLAGPPAEPNIERPIIDATGITQRIDFDLQFARFNGAATDASSATSFPSLSTALQDQLGLKLQSETGPVDVIVIDHVEEPTTN